MNNISNDLNGGHDMQVSHTHGFKHLILTNGWYLNVPGSDTQARLRLLEDVVSHIGLKFGTVAGSKKKKGVHFLAKQIGCSKRQVKLMLKSVRAPIVKVKNYPKFIFRCHNTNYVKILAEIYNRIPDINNRDLNARIYSAVKDFPKQDRVYSLAFISEPLVGMYYLRGKGTSASIRQKAHSLVEGIVREDRKYTIPQPILKAEEESNV